MSTDQNVPVGRTAAEILNGTPHGPMCPQKSSTGFCNCDHKVRAIQSVLDREAGLRAIADKLVNSGCECDPAYSTHQCLSCQARATLTPVPIEAGEVEAWEGDLTAEEQAMIDGAWEKHKAAGPCDRAPEGWRCSRDYGHDGPCAASPTADRQAAELRVAIQRGLIAELGDTYDCTRVWEAWGVGTMDQDDFAPVLDRLDEIITTIANEIALLPPTGNSRGEGKLHAHFEKMQAMCMRYLMPEPYTDLQGETAHQAEFARAHRDRLFIGDMIYMLDGPEQREAQYD